MPNIGYWRIQSANKCTYTCYNYRKGKVQDMAYEVINLWQVLTFPEQIDYRKHHYQQYIVRLLGTDQAPVLFIPAHGWDQFDQSLVVQACPEMIELAERLRKDCDCEV